MSVTDLVIDALAATRLTRLVVEDTFPPIKRRRDRFVDRHSVEEELRTPGAEAEEFAEAFGVPARAAEDLGHQHMGALDGLVSDIAQGKAVVLHGENSARVVPLADLSPEDTPTQPVLDEQSAKARAVLAKGRVTGSYWRPDDWAELITCPWCSGFWICCGVVLARRLFPRQWGPVAKALAASMLVGLVESKVDVEE